jgi:hypothetical protein
MSESEAAAKRRRTAAPRCEWNRKRQLDDSLLFEEDGRLLRTETLVASFDVDKKQLSSCVPGAEALYIGPPTRLYMTNDECPINECPFQFMRRRTAKAHDEKGERDFEEDEYEYLRLHTNAKVRVCSASHSVSPPKEGEVTVHFVFDETVVVRDKTKTKFREYHRLVDGLPTPCSGGCDHLPVVQGCTVQ